MSQIENLEEDKFGNLSSLKVIQSGPNKGRRHKEKDGYWCCIASHYWRRSQEGTAHNQWIQSLSKLGFRLGKTSIEDVSYYYLWQSKPK